MSQAGYMFFSETSGIHTKKLCHFGPKYSCQRAKTTHNNFWKETLFCSGDILENIEFYNIHILLEPLWYNNKIKIQNKDIFC